MNIVLAINSLGGGGSERVMSWLASALAQHGHCVTLLTVEGPQADKYGLDTKVDRHSLIFHRYCNSSRISAVVNFMRWRRFLIDHCRQAGADVLLSFIDGMNVYCLAALLGRRIPVVAAERTDPGRHVISPLKTLLRPWLYRNRAARVVFQSSEVAARFSAQWRLPRPHVIPNAVLPQFASAGIGRHERLVLSVGRLDPHKGHDVLLEAWHLLGSGRHDWRLQIVGSGELKAQYDALIRDYGIADSVQILPFTPAIGEAYARAGIFVLPSRVEGFPNSLIEAMAMGNAVIASDLPPACREIISHGQDGMLYNGNSAPALAQALRHLIDNQDERVRLGSAAQAVRERYSEQGVYALWEQCLTQACA